MSAKLKTYLIAGILSIIPVAVTAYIAVFIFRVLDGWAGRAILAVTGKSVPGAGLIVSILLILLVGMVTTNFVGKRIVAYLGYVVQRIPIVGRVYVGVKQITDAIGLQNTSSFKQVVLLEYPRRGVYTIAFVTSENTSVAGREGRFYNLFIPTSPNPTSGFLVVAPESELIPTGLTTEEGIKLVVSAGLVSPSKLNDLLQVE